MSVKNRLDKHDWYFTRLLVDGNDSTIVHLNHYTSSFSTNPRDIRARIKPFKLNSKGSEIIMYFPILENYNIQFDLRQRKEKVFIGTHIDPNGSFKNFFIDNEIEWEIKKLTKTEFVIEKVYNNLKYRLEFMN